MNHQDDDGWTALMSGAQSGNVEIVQALIDAGQYAHTNPLFGCS